MILRRPHEFKIATLQEIRALFPPEWNPFYAGFGNRDTDEISYRAVSVPPARIFIINPKVGGPGARVAELCILLQFPVWSPAPHLLVQVRGWCVRCGGVVVWCMLFCVYDEPQSTFAVCVMNHSPPLLCV